MQVPALVGLATSQVLQITRPAGLGTLHVLQITARVGFKISEMLLQITALVAFRA